MKLKTVALCLAVLALVAVTQVEAAYVVGDPVADFTLKDAYGQNVSLFDYQNYVVWLVFWTDT